MSPSQCVWKSSPISVPQEEKESCRCTAAKGAGHIRSSKCSMWWTSYTLLRTPEFFILSFSGYGQNSKGRLMRTQSTAHCWDRSVLKCLLFLLALCSCDRPLKDYDHLFLPEHWKSYPTGLLEVQCDATLSLMYRAQRNLIFLPIFIPFIWKAVMLTVPPGCSKDWKIQVKTLFQVILL